MKRLSIVLFILILASLLAVWPHRAAAQESQPIVHAVLFYSPTCPHCEYVMTETLPPLYEKYGPQLQIIGFDVSTPQGQAMFMGALEHFGVEEGGVPFLVIDDIVLVGSQQIPEELPILVEAYLTMGGVDWPDIPGLQELLISAAQTATAGAPAPSAVPQSSTHPSSSPTAEPGILQVDGGSSDWQTRFAADRAGNSLSVVVLVGMIAGIGWAIRMFRTGRGGPLTDAWAWSIPALCVVGGVVAGYLAYVETTGVEATCGPIGDCNTVQQSSYAIVFGFLPIGTLGIIGYLAIVMAWLVARRASGRPAKYAVLLLFAMALGGTLFSIYLTFLEPFVIGATCAWCLTSAVLMTALMLLSAGAAGSAWLRLRGGSSKARQHRRA